MSWRAGEGIHPTAIVDPGARIGEGVSVGACAVIGPEVEIGEGARIGPFAHLQGRLDLGPRVQVFPYASVGEVPQDLKYRGEPTRLVVGEETVIREHATLHTGTGLGGGVTRVGARCLVMVGVHVAHDCDVGDDVILANGVGLGGHVFVGDHVVMGAMAGVHQFCRIGAHAMVGAMSAVDGHVPPFCQCMGNRAQLDGLNLVGLRRRGFRERAIDGLKRAYEALTEGEGRIADRLARISAEIADGESDAEEVRMLVEFVASCERRPLMRARRN